MSFSDGDFVKVEYSIWRASDNQLIRTTDKKAAEEKGIYDSKAVYSPQLVVVGKGNMFRKVDDAIKGMAVGENRKVELAPEDAYGQRNKDLVRVMPLSEFRKREINPEPGLQIEIDGGIATVMSVNSGRVLVDANHPLAGERLVYEIRAVEKVEGDDAKVKALLENYSLSADEVRASGDMVKVRFGEKVEKNADYFINKSEFAAALLRYMDKISRVSFEEDYSRNEEKKEG